MLEKILRPAAGGIHTVSTGVASQRAIQQRIYGSGSALEAGDVDARWRAALGRIADAEVVILGIPSDVGAGFQRGANFGPQALRETLLQRDSWLYRDKRIVDIGDVFVVPQLLHDEMLSAAQYEATRQALYPNGEKLPVSPLSIAEAALREVKRIAPKAKPMVLGGDHSNAWPVVAVYGSSDMGILHFDAHTDLLEMRLGIRYCFATWAYHANEVVGRQQRLQQVGLRISGKTREHWESTLGVRQHWTPVDATAAAQEIIATWRQNGVKRVYISNDIDGTDPAYAASTGTSEPRGLSPEEVKTLISTVGGAFDVVASDMMEVAPGLSLDQPGEPGRTLATACDYLELQAEVMLSTSK